MAALFLKTEELNEVDINSENVVELKDNDIFSVMENGTTNKKSSPSDPPVINISNYDSEDENLVILNMILKVDFIWKKKVDLVRLLQSLE